MWMVVESRVLQIKSNKSVGWVVPWTGVPTQNQGTSFLDGIHVLVGEDSRVVHERTFGLKRFKVMFRRPPKVATCLTNNIMKCWG